MHDTSSSYQKEAVSIFCWNNIKELNATTSFALFQFSWIWGLLQKQDSQSERWSTLEQAEDSGTSGFMTDRRMGAAEIVISCFLVVNVKEMGKTQIED